MLAHGSASRIFQESGAMRTQQCFSIKQVTSVKERRMQGAWPVQLTSHSHVQSPPPTTDTWGLEQHMASGAIWFLC